MILTISDIAKRWGCNWKTVKNEMEKGNLKYFTFGSQLKPQYRVRQEWLDEYERRFINERN